MALDNGDLIQFFFLKISWRYRARKPNAFGDQYCTHPARFGARRYTGRSWGLALAPSTLAVADVTGLVAGAKYQLPSAVQTGLNYFVHAHRRGSKGACVPERLNQNKLYTHARCMNKYEYAALWVAFHATHRCITHQNNDTFLISLIMGYNL